MAVAASSSTALAVTTDPEIERMLGLKAAAEGASYLKLFASKKEEIETGSKLFRKAGLSNYTWNFSDTYVVIPSGRLQQDIGNLALGFNFSDEFAKRFIGIAQLCAKQRTVGVTFCTDASSQVFLRVIATCTDANGNHHIKVVYAENGFTLAQKVERTILKDIEPIYAERKTEQSLLCIFEHRRSETVQIGQKRLSEWKNMSLRNLWRRAMLRKYNNI